MRDIDPSDPRLAQMPPAVVEALRRGQKIEAIKLLIQHHRHLGLREAKRSVEMYEHDHSTDAQDVPQAPELPAHPLDERSPGEVAPTSNRLTLTILLAAVVYLLYLLLLD